MNEKEKMLELIKRNKVVAVLKNGNSQNDRKNMRKGPKIFNK